MPRSNSNAPIFWSVLVAVVGLDLLTKIIAVSKLTTQFDPRDVIGDAVRFTLVYNRGAAFGLHVGEYSRWVFLALTIAALFILGRVYLQTSPGDRQRTLAHALVCGGAVGNLIDRVFRDRGVVDFIDVGVGATRWPTFNVADMAVSTGAFLLAWVLWGEDRRAAEVEAAAKRGDALIQTQSRPDLIEGRREAM
jgi:signal peptidase II